MDRRIRLLILSCLTAAFVYAGPLCSNCITHVVLANDAAGDPNASSFHPNHNDRSFFSPSPISPHPGSGQLLIFLPGSGVDTRAYVNFAEFAAARGYHVVILSYFNLLHGVHTCNSHPDCYEPFRKQIWDASTVNGQWNLNTLSGASSGSANFFTAKDAVRNRLINFMLWLKQHGQGGENWGQFLVNANCTLQTCEIQWGKAVLAGHSLGSGEAAFVATERDVARIIMFSGVDDQSATWTQAPRTHPEKYFGLANLCDITFYDATVQNWANFHMPGPRTYIEHDLTGLPPATHNQTCPNLPASEASAAPYGNSHQLISGYNNACAGGSGHSQDIVSCNTEPANLLDAWAYLLGVPQN